MIIERLQRLFEDKPTEVTSVCLRLRFLTLTLLHEEPTATPSDGIDPEITGQQKIFKMSKDYFSRVVNIDTLSSSEDNPDEEKQKASCLYGCPPLTGATAPLRALRDQISAFCVHDHIGLVAQGMQLEANQMETRIASTLRCNIIVATADLLEVLFERKNSRGLSMPFP